MVRKSRVMQMDIKKISKRKKTNKKKSKSKKTIMRTKINKEITQQNI